MGLLREMRDRNNLGAIDGCKLFRKTVCGFHEGRSASAVFNTLPSDKVEILCCVYIMNILFGYARLFTRRSICSSVIRFDDVFLSNTPFESAPHFSEYFTSTYLMNDFRLLPTLPTCPEEMPPIEILPALVLDILSNIKPSKSFDTDGLNP